LPFYPHGIKRLGSPGYETEEAFYKWLKSLTDTHSNKYNIYNWIWKSYDKKALFDFSVMSSNIDEVLFYIDIVGFYYTENGRLRLNTAHKNWKELLDFAKNDIKDSDYSEYRAYLAFNEFVDYGLQDSFNHWNFIRIKKDLPIGDLYLGKDRNKSIRSADYIFMNKSKETNRFFELKPRFTPKQLAKVDEWIYGNVKA
jgi:hypothetical protein